MTMIVCSRLMLVTKKETKKPFSLIETPKKYVQIPTLIPLIELLFRSFVANFVSSSLMRACLVGKEMREVVGGNVKVDTR
jgi:hypothetical protein